MKKSEKFNQMEEQLEPCPMCGFPARITSINIRFKKEEVTVRCTGCGLTLDWAQDFIHLGLVRVPDGLNFMEAWNRRVKQ